MAFRRFIKTLDTVFGKNNKNKEEEKKSESVLNDNQEDGETYMKRMNQEIISSMKSDIELIN
jgi:hypothetical protein